METRRVKVVGVDEKYGVAIGSKKRWN